METEGASMTTLSFQPEADRYYAEGYWRAGDLWTDFAARAHAQPDKVALVLDDRRVTYHELRRAAVALSARLAAGSVQPGDVVVLLGRHSIEAAVAMLGCLHRGVVLAPLPPMFNVTQLIALARQTEARAIVGFGGEREIAKCEQAASVVEQLILLLPATLDELIAADAPDERSERGADDIAMVMHSSGTTSAPKGIVHSSNTLRYATEGICGRWRLSGEDVYLVATEFGFVGGMVFGYLPVLLNGGTGVLMGRWKPEEALRLIEEHGCTYVLLMPTHAADTLVAAQATTRDLSSMRVLAAPGLTPERRLAMQDAFGIPPLADYGLSEVPGHAAHALQEQEAKMLTTEGRPYDGTEIRIVDRSGAPLPAGQVGDVVVNGPSRFLFFLGNAELTRNSLTSWGGYRTGDLGYLDDDGHLVYVGRSKDIIRRGGVTVVPAELEPVLLRHAAVHEAAVVPLPDERLGERACAALILRPGERAPTLPELQEFLEREGVAKYMWPESIEVFDEFPRTPSLKVVKREVVQQIVGRASDPQPEMGSGRLYADSQA
jgi:cyclohexanecarboxylate-CoA ligase